jgi:hypothetical protein
VNFIQAFGGDRIAAVDIGKNSKYSTLLAAAACRGEAY